MGRHFIVTPARRRRSSM